MRSEKVTISSFLFIGLVTAIPAFASTIAQIEAQPSGTAVSLNSNPVITVIGSAPGTADGYSYTNYAIIAADATGSIDLFGRLPTGDSYIPTVGDAVSAAGTYSPFDAIPEIASLTSLSQVSSGNAVPAPILVTTAALAGITSSSLNYLGHYLELHNVEFSGASGNFPTHANGTYTVTDLSGNNPLTLFQWASSYSTAGALGGTPVPTGPVNIYGIVDIFNGTPEFVPFSITPAAASTPEPGSAGLILVGGIAAQLLLRRRIAATPRRSDILHHHEPRRFSSCAGRTEPR
jgi:hypothetical protein